MKTELRWREDGAGIRNGTCETYQSIQFQVDWEFLSICKYLKIGIFSTTEVHRSAVIWSRKDVFIVSLPLKISIATKAHNAVHNRMTLAHMTHEDYGIFDQWSDLVVCSESGNSALVIKVREHVFDITNTKLIDAYKSTTAGLSWNIEACFSIN